MDSLSSIAYGPEGLPTTCAPGTYEPGFDLHIIVTRPMQEVNSNYIACKTYACGECYAKLR